MSTELLPTSSIELDLSEREPRMRSTVRHEIDVTFKQGGQAVLLLILIALFWGAVVYVALISQPVI